MQCSYKMSDDKLIDDDDVSVEDDEELSEPDSDNIMTAFHVPSLRVLMVLPAWFMAWSILIGAYVITNVSVTKSGC